MPQTCPVSIPSFTLPMSLGKDVPIFIIQNDVQESHQIIVGARWIPSETGKQKQERVARAATPTGKIIVDGKDVSTENILSDLEREGYVLVDCTVQERIDRKRAGKLFFSQRLSFARKADADVVLPPQDIARIRIQLITLLGQSTWRVKGYMNPFFAGEGLSKKQCDGLGVFALVISFRTRLTNQDGSPAMKDGCPIRSRKTLYLSSENGPYLA